MKTNLARLSTFAICMFTINVAHAQSSVGVSLGSNFSQISYTNSQGTKYKSFKGLPGVAAAFLYKFPLSFKGSSDKFNKNLLQVHGGYKTASFKDIGSNLLTTWTINYLSSSIGYRYQKASKKPVAPTFAFSIVNDYLLNGVQNRGFEQYDLTKDFRRLNVSGELSAGINYTMSEASHCGLVFCYGRGLTNIEKDLHQRTMLHSFQLSAIIFFSLSKQN